MNQQTPPGTAHPAQKPGAVKKEPQAAQAAQATQAAQAAQAAATTDAAAQAEVKAPKVKKVKERKEGSVVRPRLPKPPDDHIITVLKPNAKREASGLRFNEYKTGMTVKQYVDVMTAPPWNRTAGQVFADIRWDTEEHRKFIHIGPTVVEVPPPAPKKEPATATQQPAPGASPTA
jgi:hypothetical protein